MSGNSILLNSVWVGVGGFIGSLARYWLGIAVYTILKEPLFPYGTLLINILGSFAIGFLIIAAAHYAWFGPQLRLFVFIGLLGGFTTFSAFTLQTMELVLQGYAVDATANILLNVVLGLLAVWIGYRLALLILPV